VPRNGDLPRGSLTGRIETLLARDEHADALAAFYRETWDRGATAESVRANRRRAALENLAEPGAEPPIAIVLEGTRVIGHCGTIPQRMWDGVAEHPAYWMKGLMVLPPYRRGPIGWLICKALAARARRATMLAAAPAARRLFGALGYADLGAVANFVRALRPRALVQRLDPATLGVALPRWLPAAVRVAQRLRLAPVIGTGAGLAGDLGARAGRRASARFARACAAEPPSREDLDELWRSVRGDLAASQVRDGSYLRWRFGTGSPGAQGDRYVFVTARDGPGLAGVAVVREPREVGDPRLGGARVATVSDIVVSPRRSDAGLAVLAGVEDAVRAANGDAILCTTSHRALVPLLRRQAYVRLPGNVHFFVGDRSAATRWPQDLASWWLARGDGEADEVF
jgi:Acetyltransferase (GNAT) family